jgi:hypothetical protein
MQHDGQGQFYFFDETVTSRERYSVRKTKIHTHFESMYTRFPLS